MPEGVSPRHARSLVKLNQIGAVEPLHLALLEPSARQIAGVGAGQTNLEHRLRPDRWRTSRNRARRTRTRRTRTSDTCENGEGLAGGVVMGLSRLRPEPARVPILPRD